MYVHSVFFFKMTAAVFSYTGCAVHTAAFIGYCGLSTRVKRRLCTADPSLSPLADVSAVWSYTTTFTNIVMFNEPHFQIYPITLPIKPLVPTLDAGRWVYFSNNPTYASSVYGHSFTGLLGCFRLCTTSCLTSFRSLKSKLDSSHLTPHTFALSPCCYCLNGIKM